MQARRGLIQPKSQFKTYYRQHKKDENPELNGFKSKVCNDEKVDILFSEF